ncbi:type II toxin-antitoxin system RelE/ParE family toxin [Algoriphagus marinus]|uniref:type II toxin-antitoxin system RelE/ParE family toxin n=1 Tax=Algoriphagus marinus TaxID=1925762 RepID=UPI00094B88E3|nr:hypothetical protein [Algoriphagus marinus]
MAEKEVFEVIVTNPAMYRFQDEILGYIEKNFSISRAIEIEAGLLKTVRSISINPFRGTKDSSIKSMDRVYRFILFKETRYFELKILFYIDEQAQKVFVTDFFPTRMNPSNMKIQ